jgi:hypothetical protein
VKLGNPSGTWNRASNDGVETRPPRPPLILRVEADEAYGVRQAVIESSGR